MDRLVCSINGSIIASYNKGGGVIRKNLLLIAGADNESAAMSGAAETLHRRPRRSDCQLEQAKAMLPQS
jgi:hypothetical protein